MPRTARTILNIMYATAGLALLGGNVVAIVGLIELIKKNIFAGVAMGFAVFMFIMFELLIGVNTYCAIQRRKAK